MGHPNQVGKYLSESLEVHHCDGLQSLRSSSRGTLFSIRISRDSTILILTGVKLVPTFHPDSLETRDG